MHIKVRAQPLDHTLTRQLQCQPPPPHTIALWGACHTQCGARHAVGDAMPRGAPACSSLETADRGTPLASTRQNTRARPLPQLPVSTKHHPRHTQRRSPVRCAGGRQRGARRSGTAPTSAPFAKLQPPPGHAQTVIFRHYCLMLE